jgi:hypothetical protein
MVTYYGLYSSVSRGRRKEENRDGLIPPVFEPTEHSKGVSEELGQAYPEDI